MNRLAGAIRKGISGVKDAHAKMVREAEARAKAKMEHAKTKMEKERAKVELAREKLRLQREFYEAKAAVIREREALAKARRAAGIVPISERLGKAWTKLYRGTPKKTRKTTHKKRKA